MVRYILEEANENSNVFLVDEEHNIKVLIAVVFDKAHARIILRSMNEYVNGTKLPKKNLKV